MRRALNGVFRVLNMLLDAIRAPFRVFRGKKDLDAPPEITDEMDKLLKEMQASRPDTRFVIYDAHGDHDLIRCPVKVTMTPLTALTLARTEEHLASFIVVDKDEDYGEYLAVCSELLTVFRAIQTGLIGKIGVLDAHASIVEQSLSVKEHENALWHMQLMAKTLTLPDFEFLKVPWSKWLTAASMAILQMREGEQPVIWDRWSY